MPDEDIQCIQFVCPTCDRVKMAGAENYVAIWPSDSKMEGAIVKECPECFTERKRES